MTGEGADHPFVDAVRPLVDALGGELIPATRAAADDVVLTWEGAALAAVRLPHLAQCLDRMLAGLERHHGCPLAELEREEKRRVVRALEERGAFLVRHGVETVAAALGVSRFTVYNYLHRDERARRE